MSDPFSEGSSSRSKNENDRFIGSEQAEQRLLMDEQDQQLDSVLNTVHNLREIAVTMGGELDDHHMLLEDLDNQLDSTDGKLKMARKRVDRFLEKSSESTCCITVLIVVLFILLLLVLLI
ncbi:hypothetical protein K7432_017277 [Basidiobolus ranarum]|uniref:t-SNARE coiled-coil homology domain-containing protein n=1 Tax=Basidiobolus ranarum TaxID=34480 RepID=A0ABR2VKK7_9FUNG